MAEFLGPVAALALVATTVAALAYRDELADLGRRLAATLGDWWEGLPPSELDVRGAARRHQQDGAR